MTKLKIYVIFFIIALMMLSCEDNTSLALLSNTLICDENVNSESYTLTLKGWWKSSNIEAKNIPGNAHFSPFVVFVHTVGEYIFEVGKLASAELESLAETGSTSIKNIVYRRPNIACVIVGSRSLQSTEENSIYIPVNTTYNTITVLSMIAPSSDWIVSERDTLFDGSAFKQNGSFDLKNYDVGTEQDTVFFSFHNADENPKKNISDLTTPFRSTDVLVKGSYRKN